MLPHADGEVLDDEVVIIHSFGLVDELKVFEPYIGVGLPGVSGDVGGWSEAWWETTLSGCDDQRPVAPGHPG